MKTIKPLFVLSLFCLTNLYAIDLQIKPDVNTTVSSLEADQMITLFSKKRIRIEKQDAKKAVLDNRILSNAFLKEDKIPEYLLADITLAIEETLSELYVKQNQEKIEINDQIIESYYKTNQKEFIKDNIFDLDAYTFTSFDKALPFYQTYQFAPEKAKQYAMDSNISMLSEKLEYKKIAPAIKSVLQDHNKTNYFTAPIVLKEKTLVVHVKAATESGYYTLEESKEKIKTILLQKIFATTRSKLLADLIEKEKNK